MKRRARLHEGRRILLQPEQAQLVVRDDERRGGRRRGRAGQANAALRVGGVPPRERRRAGGARERRQRAPRADYLLNTTLPSPAVRNLYDERRRDGSLGAGRALGDGPGGRVTEVEGEMPPVSLSERSRDRRRSSRPSRAFGRPEARARYRRSAALGDRHTPRVVVDREVGTHSIALLTMRAPNARTGAAAHMYMMFFAVVGSIFVCRRPMDARGRVRSRRAQARQLRKKIHATARRRPGTKNCRQCRTQAGAW